MIAHIDKKDLAIIQIHCIYYTFSGLQTLSFHWYYSLPLTMRYNIESFNKNYIIMGLKWSQFVENEHNEKKCSHF